MAQNLRVATFYDLPGIPLTPEQKPLYEDMKKTIAAHLNVFRSETAEGALIGPWNPWLHEPIIGGAVWELAKSSRPRQLCRRLRGR
jgi:4-carboxymuconolactone decarboxylase